MNRLEFVRWAYKMAKNHPQHKAEIEDLVELALDEIEGGGSEAHEIELAVGDIKDILSDEEDTP